MADGHLIAGADLERYWRLHDVLASFHKIFNEHQSTDDRTIAIIAATYLDELLENTLINFMVDDEKEVKRLVNFDGSMGTYSSRVTSTYCLGLIPKIVRDDLRFVGKIRNKFAHQLEASFDEEAIRAWCFSLKWHEFSMMMKPPEGTTAKEVFKVGVNQLISYMNGIVGVARLERRQAAGGSHVTVLAS